MENAIATAWQRVLEDPILRDLPYKIETNEWGQIILSRRPIRHSLQQGRLVGMLFNYETEPGIRAVEFAVETRLGVKVPDVVWISQARLDALPEDPESSPIAPEICIEVLSRANTEGEMAEKRTLYFEQGAEEVWLCDETGRLSFYLPEQSSPAGHSRRMPDFPGLLP